MTCSYSAPRDTCSPELLRLVGSQELLHAGVVDLQFAGANELVLQVLAIDLKLQVAFLVQQLLADLVALGGKIRFIGGRVRNHFEQHLVGAGGNDAAHLPGVQREGLAQLGAAAHAFHVLVLR